MPAALLRPFVVLFVLTALPLWAADYYVDIAIGSNAFDGVSPTVGGGHGPKLTVNAAIGIATGGDTIHIAAGTYVEQVSLTTNLTLLGAGSGSTTLKLPAAPTTNVLGTDYAVVFAGASGANVTLQSLTIQGPGPNGGPALYGIFAGNTTHLIVTDCIVRDITDNPFGGVQHGNAIQVGRNALAQAATATITNVQVINYQKTGIIVDGPGSNASIINCQITGVGPTGAIAQNGIQISRTATATISGTTVTGNYYTNGVASCDVLLFQNGAVSIDTSTFTGSNVAVDVTQSSATGTVGLTGCTLGTSLSGNDEGLATDQAGAAVTVTGSTFTNNSIQNIDITDTAGKGITFSGGNTITGGASGISVSGSPVLSLGDTSFNGQSGNVITLAAGALATKTLDATGISVNGAAVSGLTTTQLLALEDRISHGVDTLGEGLVRVKAAQLFVTQASGSIQRAIDLASAGDSVFVGPGTFNENVTVNKLLTLQGSGAGSDPTTNTVVSNGGNVITVTAGGTDSTHQTTLRALYITGGAYGVVVNSTLGFLTLDTITATKLGQYGVFVGPNAILNAVTLLNCNLSANNTNLQAEQAGLWIDGAIDGLTITNGHFDSNTYGLYTRQLPVPANPLRPLTNVLITNTTFSTNFSKGIYAEKLDHATLTNIVVDGSGYSRPQSAAPDPLAFFVPPAGIDINLKYSTYTSIVLNNATVTNCGANNPTQASAVAIKGRDDPSNYNTNPALLNGVQIVGGTFQTPPYAARPAFSFGNNATNIVFSGGVNVTGTGVGVSSYINSGGTIDLGNTSLANTLAQYIQSLTTATITASGVNFNVSDDFAIEDKILHAVDAPGLGVVRWKSGNIFVTVNSFSAPTTTTPSLQRAVDAALSGDTVHVQAGTYGAQSVTFSAKAVTLSGPNAGVDPNVGSRGAEAIVNGASLFTLSNGSSAAVTIDGLTFDQVTGSTGVITASGSADSVTVRCNRFLSPAPAAVNLSGATRSNWTITQNRITTVQGTSAGAFSASGPSGLQLSNLNGLTCSYNFISGTPNSGILADALVSSAITGNRVLNVPQAGIQLSGTSNTVNVAFNEISNANINQSTADMGGIRLNAQTFTGAVTVQNNIVAGSVNAVAIADAGNNVSNGFTTVRNNNLSANTRGVYRAAGGTGTLNAQSNWWGSPQGPVDPSNPSGQGVAVSPGVTFSPFLIDGTDTAPLDPTTFTSLQNSVGFQPNTGLSGSAQRLVFTTQPVGSLAGSPLTTQPVVQVQDVNGNVATSFTGFIAVFLATNPSGATLTGTTVLTVTSGTATFTNLNLDQPGTGYQLLAMSSGNLAASLSATFNVQAVFNPLPTLTSLSPNSTTAGSQPLALTVTGTNFMSASKVLFGGQPRPTIYLSSTQLIAVLPDTDLATAGTFTIAVNSPAPGGGTTATLAFTVNPVTVPNAPPLMISPASATPNPAAPGQLVTLSAAAVDPENQSMTYAWNFGDGVAAGGSTVTHTFTAPGIYTVKVIVTDSAGGTTNSLVTVTVAAAATAPNETMTLKSAKFKTVTLAPAKGTAQVAGSFIMPTGVTTLAGSATILINGKTQTFTVGATGKAKVGKTTLTIKGKLKKGVLSSSSVTFAFKDFGDYSTVLINGGRPAGTSGASLIDVQLTYAGKTYEGTLQVTVTVGKTGSAAK